MFVAHSNQNQMRYLVFFSCVMLYFTTTNAQKSSYKVGLIGFYNLENLFDTIKNPAINDVDFLPDGPYHNTGKVYTDKLNKLADVLSQIGTDISPDGLSLIGNAEVENDTVLRDLINQPQLKNRNYQI